MNKHLQYLKYLLLHKWYVGIECWRRGLYRHAFTHDWTKFLPVEWFPYVNYFYGERDQASFDRAWNHHQKANPHHWQYWLLTMDDGTTHALDMPHWQRVEMLCDWIGAGRAIAITRSLSWTSESTRTWFVANRWRMNLHPETLKWMMEELNVTFGVS